jgi:hypothetical protein
LAALLDIPLAKAATNIVPVAVTASDALTRLRQWASGRCLSAQEAGLFQLKANAGRNGRRSSPNPSVN